MRAHAAATAANRASESDELLDLNVEELCATSTA